MRTQPSLLQQPQLAPLASFQSNGHPVVSLYLNVDGRCFRAGQYLLVRAHEMIKQAYSDLKTQRCSAATRTFASADLDKITRFPEDDFVWDEHRGLVIFSCSGRGLWQVYALDRPVPDQLVVSARPYVRPLAALLDTPERFSVILVDRENARYFVVSLGHIEEWPPLHDDVPRRVKGRSWHGLADKRIERHIDLHFHQHLRRAAERLAHLAEEERIERIVIGGTTDTIAAFRRTLPRRIEQLVFGDDHASAAVAASTLRLPMHSPAQKVLAQALPIIERARQKEALDLSQRVLDEGWPHGYGVVGLEPTLSALYQEAVQTMVVSRDISHPGYLCARCGRLFVASSSCPECGDAATASPLRVEDLMEAAVDEALRQSADVAFVTESSDWDGHGGIGALLRFPLLPDMFDADGVSSALSGGLSAAKI